MPWSLAKEIRGEGQTEKRTNSGDQTLQPYVPAHRQGGTHRPVN